MITEVTRFYRFRVVRSTRTRVLSFQTSKTYRGRVLRCA